ncbi:MAG TPA: hypothetical protein VJU78_07980 [Chitinophagaceae bacterium]|nr:hypothetical protein [Chitinophagaceae bacterium]
MKNIFLMLLVCVLFACNNESTDTTTKDSTVIEQDNTINRDTSVARDTGINMDTSNKKDSIK